MSKSIAQADVDFKKELSEIANQLGGAVSANSYENYILPLVFLKHLSERYEIVYEEIATLLQDPKSDYYTTNQDEINYTLENQDEYLCRNTFLVPKKASWKYLKENRKRDNINLVIDAAFGMIQDLLANHNIQLNNLLLPVFVQSGLSTMQTSEIVNLLSHPKFSVKDDPESIILDRIYEFYIGSFATSESDDTGQLFTPGGIMRLLVEIVDPCKRRVFDPRWVSGGTFVQSVKFNSKNSGNKVDVSIYGQVMGDQTLRLYLMNLLLRDLSINIKVGNPSVADTFSQLKSDYIIATLPFDLSNWQSQDLSYGAPRLFGFKKEFTADNAANYGWIQTFWDHLNDTGTAAVVMANGEMNSNAKKEKKLRKQLVNNSMIDCIVVLPDKLSLGTGIPVCLFILSKNRGGKGKKYRERNNEILFLDASKMRIVNNQKQRVFSDEDGSKITETYHKWRAVDEIYQDIDGFSKAATLAEVKKHKYKLSPSIYVNTEAKVVFLKENKKEKEPFKNQFKEATLISDLKEGKENAYKELYELYYSELYNYASNLCGSEHQAEDIVQHTMIKIWEKGSDLNIKTSLKGYLHKSIYNHFIDMQRRTKKETNNLELLKQEALLDFVEIAVDDVENIYRQIDIEIDNLPKQCREVFLLGKREGLKYKEIANQLNISIKTVERHMSIALKKLRKKLDCSSKNLYLFLTNLT